jgi:predicted nucleic acid-binding protein
MKVLFREGSRLCLAKQSLIESWVVATRPRDVNGFGLSAQFAVNQLARARRVFHILAEGDEIHREWESLVAHHQVLGKAAYDARLVAAMRVHGIQRILTYNGEFQALRECSDSSSARPAMTDDWRTDCRRQLG